MTVRIDRSRKDKPHKWVGDRCRYCFMKKSWPGARYGCPAHNVRPDRVRQDKEDARGAQRD